MNKINRFVELVNKYNITITSSRRSAFPSCVISLLNPENKYKYFIREEFIGTSEKTGNKKYSWKLGGLFKTPASLNKPTYFALDNNEQNKQKLEEIKSNIEKESLKNDDKNDIAEEDSNIFNNNKLDELDEKESDSEAIKSLVDLLVKYPELIKFIKKRNLLLNKNKYKTSTYSYDDIKLIIEKHKEGLPAIIINDRFFRDKKGYSYFSIGAIIGYFKGQKNTGRAKRLNAEAKKIIDDIKAGKA